MSTLPLQKRDVAKAIGLAVAVFIVSISFYVGSEPSLAQAVTASSNNVIVTLNVDTGISVTSPGNTTMSPDLGVVSNSAIGSSAFTVATNDPLGYTLSIAASTTPAMKSGSNYINDESATPATWTIASGAAQFGFSVYGSGVNTTTFGTDTSCGSTGTPSTNLKYRGFNGTTGITIATGSATTTPSGVTTTVCYAAGQNGTYIPSGTYTSTFTATATSN